MPIHTVIREKRKALELTQEQADLSGEEHERYQEKILARYEFVAENAKDEQIRGSAAYLLSGKYIGQGRYERAEELLELMPERGADKRKRCRSIQ